MKRLNSSIVYRLGIVGVTVVSAPISFTYDGKVAPLLRSLLCK